MKRKTEFGRQARFFWKLSLDGLARFTGTGSEIRPRFPLLCLVFHQREVWTRLVKINSFSPYIYICWRFRLVYLNGRILSGSQADGKIPISRSVKTWQRFDADLVRDEAIVEIRPIGNIRGVCVIVVWIRSSVGTATWTRCAEALSISTWLLFQMEARFLVFSCFSPY